MLCPVGIRLKEGRDVAERVCQNDLSKDWLGLTREKIEEIRSEHVRQFKSVESKFVSHKQTCDICKKDKST